LANLYYWIDLHNIGGFWATQTLPFFDAAAVSNYINFEMAVYKALNS
jgi:methyl acetate hydrolase